MNARDESIRESIRPLLEEAGLGALEGDAAVTPLEGGSDRRFTRVRGAKTSVVLLSQPPGWEIDSYVDVGRFLDNAGVPVPKILAFDRARGLVLMEDCGDLHLDDALALAPQKEILRRYREALSILVSLETNVTEMMLRGGFLEERIFDERELLGETDYFVREFVEGFCRIEIPPTWDGERHLIARSLASETAVFMHRDFQSRNLLVTDGGLRLIDFQAAYRGPGVYDAASLLKDAYRPLSTPLRRALLEELHAGLRERGAPVAERFEDYCDRFVLAGIQRNLQALAAFAKLGLRKGKPKFLDSIPPGIDLLEEGVAARSDLRALPRMVAEMRSRIADGWMKGM